MEAGLPSDAPLIAASGVTRILPGTVPTTLVHDIDLAIGTKEYVAITGPSGSGKSSLLYLLGLLDLPTAGEVRIRGRATAHMDEAERAEIRLSTLGFVFQFHFLLPEFSALENVMLPMKALGRLSAAAMRERAISLLASFGLREHVSKRPDQLSGGQRQRVAVARSLANDPPVILADEKPARSTRSPASRYSRSYAIWSTRAAKQSWPSPMISIWRDAWIAVSCCRMEASRPMMAWLDSR
jgi:lipoprotein-releasing system ATP-binding protein